MRIALVALLAALVIIPMTEAVAGTSVKLSVPFYQQTNTYSSSTNSLAMVMAYFDSTTYKPDDVWKASGANSWNVTYYGNDMQALGTAAQYYGFTNYGLTGFTYTGFAYDASLTDAQFESWLKGVLNQGVPVSVNTRPYQTPDVNRVVLVTGYDDSYFYINDPVDGQIAKSVTEFRGMRQTVPLYIPRGVFNNSAFVIYPRLTAYATQYEGTWTGTTSSSSENADQLLATESGTWKFTVSSSGTISGSVTRTSGTSYTATGTVTDASGTFNFSTVASSGWSFQMVNAAINYSPRNVSAQVTGQVTGTATGKGTSSGGGGGTTTSGGCFINSLFRP